MVTDEKQDSSKTPAKQGPECIESETNKINASTPFDFTGKNLTPYGGLLPVITMLEKLGFQSLVEQTLTSKRIPRAMDLYRFVLGIVLGLYIGFPRLNQLRFIAETREYVWGELRNGDRPSGKQIGDHLRNVRAALPPGVKRIYGRVDSGFYCREAVEAYEEFHAWFVICARKTARLVEYLQQAEWQPSPKTDADEECEFSYQPDGWSKPYRFVALRKRKPRQEMEAEESEQYQLFETSQYQYRVFVTNMNDPIHFVVWFYGQRGGAENLIKEANNDAGLAAHPSHRFDVNSNHFQLAMLAYNLNCWLMLFNREPQADATQLHHTTLATSRLRFLFVAAKIWRHAGRTGVSYSDHYEEKGMFQQLMDRLRRIRPCQQDSAPVMLPALC